MPAYDEVTAARVRAAINDALGSRASVSRRRKRMTRAKAERLVSALTAVMECEDVEGSAAIAFDDARAEVERWL